MENGSGYAVGTTIVTNLNQHEASRTEVLTPPGNGQTGDAADTPGYGVPNDTVMERQRAVHG